MSPQKYDIINVQAYKHNGYLYRQWNGALVLDVKEEYIVLVLPQTKVIEERGQHWRIKEPTIWYFPTGNHFFNATALIRKAGYYLYTNLASPFIFEDNTIKFIDYDLDIKYYPGSSVHLVDVQEHKSNSIEYNYPADVMRRVNDSKNMLLKMIAQEKFVYNKKVTAYYYKKLLNDNQYKKTLTV